MPEMRERNLNNMKMKPIDCAPYRVYDKTGKLVLSTDERCRYSPKEELSLIESGHRIMLGEQRLSKKYVLSLIHLEGNK